MTKFSSFLVVLLLVLTSFSAHAQGYPRGDVDRDGAVNISDVTCLIDNLLKGVPEGDVDQDGSVNISDVTSLIDYLLKGSWSDDPVTPPDNHEWVDLGLPSGTLWATCNIGASAPEEYGDYFAWGETEPKETYTWENYKWCHYGDDGLYMTKYNKLDRKTVLELGDDAAFANWGASWRMPFRVQMEELANYCIWQEAQWNRVEGVLGTGPNGNTIFLPYAGSKTFSLNTNSMGCYWSCTLYPDNFDHPLFIGSSTSWLQLGHGGAEFLWYLPVPRYGGFTVRAVRM